MREVQGELFHRIGQERVRDKRGGTPPLVPDMHRVNRLSSAIEVASSSTWIVTPCFGERRARIQVVDADPEGCEARHTANIEQ